jgi:hypothetical protein
MSSTVWILAATTLIFLYTKALARRRALNGNARPAFVTDRKSPDQLFSLSAIGSISYPIGAVPFQPLLIHPREHGNLKCSSMPNTAGHSELVLSEASLWSTCWNHRSTVALPIPSRSPSRRRLVPSQCRKKIMLRNRCHFRIPGNCWRNPRPHARHSHLCASRINQQCRIPQLSCRTLRSYRPLLRSFSPWQSGQATDPR